MNKIYISLPKVKGHNVSYRYSVEGEWTEAFRLDRGFDIEYSLGIEEVPAGILIIPLLANLLPMSWIYDADIITPVCDKDFYECIREFKKGYANMYPQISFGGKLTVENIQTNRVPCQDGTTAFFSGGVDAFCTLIRHRAENPTLITLWGADVPLDDETGWRKVETHLKDVAEGFHVDSITVKTDFRKFLKENVLYRKVKASGDGWWHGFQHGVGIISHAAPVVYLLGKKTVYIASSFTSADKGKYSCASDPSIDNYVRFCGADVIHDGYELNRQEKIQIITEFSKETGRKVPLRVCWESKGGSNCCHCEKCWRTILGIYASGSDPREFGFEFDSIDNLGKEIKEKRFLLGKNKEARYRPIWNALHENYTKRSIAPGIRWFYSSRFAELETGNVVEKGYKTARRFAERLKSQLDTMECL